MKGPRQKASLIIVEDQVIVATDLEHNLLRLGYEVLGSTDRGEDAIDLAREKRPDLVMMDIRLAGKMDGIEAAVIVRRELDLPVVFLTAHADEATLQHAGEAEAFGYILKPFDDRELVTHIEMALYKHAAESRLREADRRKTQFLALLSHELRNPLAAICGGLRILDALPPGDKRHRQSRAIIDRQVNQLVRLVDDLLDVARIDQGRLWLDRKSIDLNTLVARSVEDHRILLEEAGVRVFSYLAEEPVIVNGDGARLGQVVGNLLHNAAKFTPRGGTLTLSVVADKALKQAVVQLRDTGIGMEPALLKILFQPFVQADKALAHGKGGLGLGLSVVKGLVELHGGQVSAYSRGQGLGSEFTICLPLEEETTVAKPPGDPQEPTTPRRLLIIEDNADVADSLHCTLEAAGHEVEVAYDAPSGLDKARRHPPEIIFCDLGLPGLTGFELAKILRADPSLHALSLVALSGYAHAEDVAAARAAGFDEHLAKPLNPARLAEILRNPPHSTFS